MEDLELQISQYKKKVTKIIYTILFCSVFCIIVIVLYYELKMNSLIGAAYLKDPKSADTMTYVLFRPLITSKNLSSVNEAMYATGHTEHGVWYLFTHSGQLIILFIILLFILSMFYYTLIHIRHMEERDIYSQVINVLNDNRRLNKELEANNRLLEKQKTQIQQFVENIVHQIKTPLAAASLILYSMEPKARMEQVYNKIDKVNAFVHRLLIISRMEAGKVLIHRNYFDLKCMLSDIVSDIVSDMAANAELNKSKCSVELQCSDDMEIQGDEKWLQECVMNIVQNCIESINKNGTEHGQVIVNAKDMGTKCVIVISDNGPGFSNSDINTIFNRFETNGTSEEFHVGIGLNLSKLIVQLHKGTITASNSAEYGGAEFRIILPQYHMKEKMEM